MISMEQYERDNELIGKAMKFATQKHSSQVRKGSGLPYIIHPMEVWQILRNNGCSINAQAAGLLHDTLEDTDTTPEEIRENFGEEILSLVQSESEDKSKTWKERKQHTIDHLNELAARMESLEEAGTGSSENPDFRKCLDIMCITCADKLSNCRAQLYDYSQVGDALFDRFNKQSTPELQAWYYREIARALKPLAGMKMHEELCRTVSSLYD